MSSLVLANFILPLITALWMFVFKEEKIQRVGAYINLIALSLISFALFTSSQIQSFSFNHTTEVILIVIDIALLLYFAKVGISFKEPKIYLLAFIQLLLYLFIESKLPLIKESAIVVDDLSKIMFLIINVVGSTIVLFSLRYMRDENMTQGKKSLFQIYLLLFMFIMSLAVSANSTLFFFLLFEITTLFSFLLIRFRGDENAKINANRALWMNQIGGVAILLGTYYGIEFYNTYYFNNLIENANPMFLLPFAFISMAAFVKGASIPFEKWLLGAMVAPTPVSAMLHSATMVKIAPYIIVKLSPAIAGTSLGIYITLFGSLVFMVASYLALSKDFFKEILGLSTIALLGLMMALATINGEKAFAVVTLLIIFHAVSKALLFLSAGVLEKEYHFKYVEDFKNLMETSPQLVFFIILGFASMTLPPFGVFLGKMMAIETLSVSIGNNPLLIFSLIFLGIGSTLLTLLYFKVAATLFVKDEECNQGRREIDMGFFSPLYILGSLTVIAVFLLDIPTILLSVLIITALAPFIFNKFQFKYDRVKEYACGEKEKYTPNLYFFSLDTKQEKKMYKIFILGFILIAVVGGLL